MKRISVTLSGSDLTPSEVLAVADQRAAVSLSDSESVTAAITASVNQVQAAVNRADPIYGITTLFGGLATDKVDAEKVCDLQRSLILSHYADFGERLPVADVRAAMLIRANTLAKGVSGVSIDLIQRYIDCLNLDITPVVKSLGSIGASGDLIPLSVIAGSLLGLSEQYQLMVAGQTENALSVLAAHNFKPYALQAKEGLALINGTSMMAALGVRNLLQWHNLYRFNLALHALSAQALTVNVDAFHPFIHAVKPHVGQAKVAATMLQLLQGSKATVATVAERYKQSPGEVMQDRYSLRCLPQFMGPLLEQVELIEKQLTVEINSATDNPLIDVGGQQFLHGGNFLGQHISLGMDQLRMATSLLAKHLDVQVAQLMSPEFSRGLSASLVGNQDLGINIGLKPVQLLGNSILPLIEHMGNSIADRFPTHAEQFNQNINSQGMGAALQTRKSLALWRQQSAAAAIVACQAVDLRAKRLVGSYAADQVLSESTATLYHAIKQVLGCPSDSERPLVWNDDEQSYSAWLAVLEQDLLRDDSQLLQSLPGEGA